MTTARLERFASGGTRLASMVGTKTIDRRIAGVTAACIRLLNAHQEGTDSFYAYEFAQNVWTQLRLPNFAKSCRRGAAANHAARSLAGTIVDGSVPRGTRRSSSIFPAKSVSFRHLTQVTAEMSRSIDRRAGQCVPTRSIAVILTALY
jgi:hypothetical protein